LRLEPIRRIEIRVLSYQAQHIKQDNGKVVAAQKSAELKAKNSRRPRFDSRPGQNIHPSEKRTTHEKRKIHSVKKHRHSLCTLKKQVD